MDDCKYKCDRCGCEMDSPEWVDASIDLGEIGVKPEWAAVCPECGSEELTPMHDCANDCGNLAEYDAELCDECFGKLVKKLLAFVDDLTPAEREVVGRLNEDENIVNIRDAIRKSGEWLDSRL